MERLSRRRGRGACVGGIVALLASAWASSAPRPDYVYLSYDEIRDTLYGFQALAPHLVKVYTAQAEYGVPTYGTCGASNEPCTQYYIVITNNATLSLEDGERPEVFFSGEVHGNERVGPTATVEFARLLLTNYINGSNPWLRRLVDTRIIVIMPTANAHGYSHNVRTEGPVDPNRDFPFGNGAQDCMKSSAARAINELYRDHLFQLALTFHSGMKAIAYEWGSMNHPRGNDISPDHGGFSVVGDILHTFASNGFYPDAAPINTIVYPVAGGMEDWAYAASWDTSYAPTCGPETFGGYPANKTQYTSDMLRTFNILIETSTVKAPTGDLGSPDDVILGSGSPHDGHVARNLRLCLAMTDLVRPYLLWQSPTDVVTPSVPSTVSPGDAVDLAWDVAGAHDVEATGLVRVPWTGSACPRDLDNVTDSQAQRFVSMLAQLEPSLDNVSGTSSDGSVVGQTLWSSPHMWPQVPQDPDVTSASWTPYMARYQATYTFDPADAGRVVLLAAYARVDAGWADAGSSSMPRGMPPQAHVVKARTVAGYRAENAGHVITGHTVWYSMPRCYQILDAPLTGPSHVDPSTLATGRATTTSATTLPGGGGGGGITSPSAGPPSGDNCGPAGTCGEHAQCQGLCPPPGPCASVHCVCNTGYTGDGYTCTRVADTTLSGQTWDCALSLCLAQIGRCERNTECRTSLLTEVESGRPVTLPPSLSDEALTTALPLLSCSDSECGTLLMDQVPDRILANSDDSTNRLSAVDDNAARAGAVVVFAGVMVILIYVMVSLYRRRTNAYAPVLTENFNPMWSVDDDEDSETDGDATHNHLPYGGDRGTLEEFYARSMQADETAGMAAAIGGGAVSI
eukprot:m.130967 g.130967  ORF g.130967 m.130967 type:complete len:854 (-) comp11301_c0_seq2:1014-3575(-)